MKRDVRPRWRRAAPGAPRRRWPGGDRGGARGEVRHVAIDEAGDVDLVGRRGWWGRRDRGRRCGGHDVGDDDVLAKATALAASSRPTPGRRTRASSPPPPPWGATASALAGQRQEAAAEVVRAGREPSFTGTFVVEGTTGMHVFGLTGGIASGKSAVGARWRARGVPIVDADVLAPRGRGQVLAPPGHWPRVVAAFGAEVLTPAGELDRKKMGERRLRRPLGPRALERDRPPPHRCAHDGTGRRARRSRGASGLLRSGAHRRERPGRRLPPARRRVRRRNASARPHGGPRRSHRDRGRAGASDGADAAGNEAWPPPTSCDRKSPELYAELHRPRRRRPRSRLRAAPLLSRLRVVCVVPGMSGARARGQQDGSRLPRRFLAPRDVDRAGIARPRRHRAGASARIAVSGTPLRSAFDRPAADSRGSPSRFVPHDRDPRGPSSTAPG